MPRLSLNGALLTLSVISGAVLITVIALTQAGWSILFIGMSDARIGVIAGTVFAVAFGVWGLRQSFAIWSRGGWFRAMSAVFTAILVAALLGAGVTLWWANLGSLVNTWTLLETPGTSHRFAVKETPALGDTFFELYEGNGVLFEPTGIAMPNAIEAIAPFRDNDYDIVTSAGQIVVSYPDGRHGRHQVSIPPG